MADNKFPFRIILAGGRLGEEGDSYRDCRVEDRGRMGLADMSRGIDCIWELRVGVIS